jgi:PleD family two-component response regulator
MRLDVTNRGNATGRPPAASSRTAASSRSAASSRTAASIGIAALDCVPLARESAVGVQVEDLLHAADLAMYEAKARGRNQHVIHRPPDQ